MTVTSLTLLELHLIDAIRDGLRDYADLAEEVGVTRNAARRALRRLCRRYDCALEELPGALDRAAGEE